MMDQEVQLFDEFEKIFRIRNECSCQIFSECGLSDMTVRQIAYLKVIDEQGHVTFSRLAEITQHLKTHDHGDDQQVCPDGCVYREPCPDDGRILYIHLTEKGKKIAQAEQAALRRVIEQMADALDEDELDLLIGILRKVR